MPISSTMEFFERTTDCVYIADAEWRIIYCNERAKAELRAGDLVGRTIAEAFPGYIGTAFENQYRKSVELQESRTFEAFYAPLNGWYQVHAVPAGSELAVFFRNITDRRRSDEAAEARQQALGQMLGKSFIGLLQYDGSDRLVTADEAFCRLVGRDLGQIATSKLETFAVAEDRSLLAGLLSGDGSSGSMTEIELRLDTAQGPRWCAVTMCVVTGYRDAELFKVILIRDIDQQRRAEKQAVEFSSLVETIINSAEDLIFAKDIDGRFILVNNALQNSGLSLLGRKVEDEFSGHMAAGYSSVDAEVMLTRSTRSVEEIIPIKGEPRMFQTIKVPWTVGGQVRGVIGISRDITERIEAEARVRQSEETYRLAARATNDAIWDWDIVTNEITWTEAIEPLAGERPEPTLDWWSDRIHHADRADVLDDLHRFIEEGGENWQQEYRFRRHDGSFAIVLDRGFIFRDADGVPTRMIGAMADMTARVEAERRLHELQTELIHVSRVSAMGTMASALAHEINQPLTSIANYVAGARRLIERRDEASLDQVSGALQKTAAEATRVGEMIRRLRRMVMHGTTQFQPVEISSMFKDALALALPNRALAGVDVAVRVPARAVAMADPIQVQQVLINLIRNAVEAMEGRDPRELTLSATASGDRWMIHVRDSGSGLQPEIREGLFTAFKTTKPDGLGVGLTICRTIVEAHGGRLRVDSSDASGTTISFDLGLAAGLASG